MTREIDGLRGAPADGRRAGQVAPGCLQAQADREVGVGGVDCAEGEGEPAFGGDRGHGRLGVGRRCERAVPPGESDAGGAVVIAAERVLHDPPVRGAAEGTAQRERQSGVGRGHQVQAAVRRGGGPERVGEPGGEGEDGTVGEDDGRRLRQDVDGGRETVVAGCVSTIPVSRYLDGAGRCRLPGPHRAAEQGRQASADRARERRRLRYGGGGAGLRPPVGERGSSDLWTKQAFRFARGVDEQRGVYGDEGHAVRAAQLNDSPTVVLGKAQPRPTGEEPDQQRTRVRHLGGEHDDVLCHAGASVPFACRSLCTG